MLHEMSQYHFSSYDYHTEEILHPPENPESILCSCFVVAQQEQGVVANLQHHDEEVSVESEMASQETCLSQSEESWAPSNFASTPVEASPASLLLPLSDMHLQLTTPPTNTNTATTVGYNRLQEQQHLVVARLQGGRPSEGGMEQSVQRALQESEEEEGEEEQREMESFVDDVRQFTCYSYNTFLQLNPNIFSLV